MRFSPPTPIQPEHDTSRFDSGVEALDIWLKRNALSNETGDASRTYVVTQGHTVVAYYCLSAGAIIRSDAPKNIQRNMPDSVPVMVLGRLAVDTSLHGQGFGSALLRDAIFRTLKASEIAGIKALLVHAISPEAKDFYLRQGFVSSPVHPMTLLLTMKSIRAALNG